MKFLVVENHLHHKNKIGMKQINNVHNNSVYIQPSDWARDVWKNMGTETAVHMKRTKYCFVRYVANYSYNITN
jgi:hypothetical protein